MLKYIRERFYKKELEKLEKLKAYIFSNEAVKLEHMNQEQEKMQKENLRLIQQKDRQDLDQHIFYYIREQFEKDKSYCYRIGGKVE